MSPAMTAWKNVRQMRVAYGSLMILPVDSANFLKIAQSWTPHVRLASVARGSAKRVAKQGQVVD